MRLTGPKLGLNLRTTGAAHVTLYRTWCLSDLFTGPHGQVSDRRSGSREFHNEMVSWSLTSLFSTNMAISEMKGQGWKVIHTQ